MSSDEKKIQCCRCKTMKCESLFYNLNGSGKLMKSCHLCQRRNIRYYQKKKAKLMVIRNEKRNKILSEVKDDLKNLGLTKAKLQQLYNSISKNNLWDDLE